MDLEDIVDQAVTDLQSLISTGTISEDSEGLYKAFGGKPGAGTVAVPSNITDEQILAYFDFVGTPLTGEEEKATILKAIREKQKNASKNITTEPAKSKEVEIDYKEKIRTGNITVGEAFEAVLAKRLTDSNRDDISTLYRALSSEGIDLDANYFDVYDTKEFAESLDHTTNTSGTHRFKEFGAFETQFNGLVGDSKRNEAYRKLSGKTGIASTSYGLTGVQLRVQDPMRGLVPSESFDKIFNDALSVDEVTVDDTKTGKKKTITIDPEARDYLIYERYTGQRTKSNIGADGLKIGDIQFYKDENNQLVVEIAEKKVGGKTRPSATYSGAFAEFLQDKVNRADAKLLEGADRNTVNLFQTSERKVTELWDTLIRPELEKKHSRVLPAGKGGSHSVLRKILSRQLVQEFKFPPDAVKAWMGHAGAGVNSSGDMLEGSYTGSVPDDRIGPMTDMLIKNDAFNNGVTSANEMFINRGISGFGETSINYAAPTSKLVYTGDNSIFQPKVERQFTEAEKAAIDAEAGARAEKAELSRLQTAEEKRQFQRQVALAREEEKKADKARSVELGITEEAAAKGDVPPDYKPMFEDGKFDLNKLPEDVAERLKKAMGAAADKLPGPVKKALGPIGAGLTTITAAATTKEVQAATGSPTLATIAGASEFGPIGYSDIRDIAAARAEPDPFGLTPASRIAAEEEAGFINLGRNRGPEATPVSQEQGFASRNNGR